MKDSYLRCGAKRKFIVFKLEDVEKLGHYYQRALEEVAYIIERNRRANEQTVDNEYLVINTDEPYRDEIIDVLKRNGHWG